MATKKTKKIKLKFVCPYCGSENCLEEIERINELHVPVLNAYKLPDGDIDMQFGEADLSEAEVIEAYYRCSDCYNDIVDPESCFVPDK